MSASKPARTGTLTDARRSIRGRGLTIELPDGTTLLDAVSGTFNLPLGYSYPGVVAAIREQATHAVHLSSEFTGERAQAAVRPLLEKAPPGITKAWVRDITGSTANECAVRIAQKATGRREVLSLFLSHHGQTLFTTALSGNSFRRSAFPAAQSGSGVKIPAPYCHRCFYGQNYPDCGLMCADRMEDFLEFASGGSVAAVIVEPVLGNGGNIVPPPGYFERLRDICDRHGILIIADEVQTGLGRLGTVFGSSAVGLRPDIITLAKGLGGVGMPIAAVLMRPELDVLAAFEHSFTSGANPLALAAMEATIEVIADDEFLAEVRRKGAELGDLLKDLGKQSALVSEVRGLGMMWGLEISDSDGSPDAATAREIIRVARAEERLVLRPSRYGFGNVVKVRPALVARDDEITDITERLARTLTRVEKQISTGANR
ncbi:4-aminobutyrate aminotransferase [Nocardia tenerifensis]|uniref:4-aminobutyrate aminotransferase n=1 Tax=Nocardia tenerifensis TaxID=228006 RepID=A0A318JX62_9NOCA|nr:aspartate aminotransferase family protein [Nocardia tenerifensis]PXX59331.1 4-aminobutyrate aminotransferase [Nocardia tenerifensis]